MRRLIDDTLTPYLCLIADKARKRKHHPKDKHREKDSSNKKHKDSHKSAEEKETKEASSSQKESPGPKEVSPTSVTNGSSRPEPIRPRPKTVKTVPTKFRSTGKYAFCASLFFNITTRNLEQEAARGSSLCSSAARTCTKILVTGTSCLCHCERE